MALRETAGNGNFHEEKLPRQKARQKLRVWQGVWLLPGSKPRAKCFFVQHLQPSGPPWVGIAEQRAEQAQPRPGASQLRVPRAHKAGKEPAGSLAAPSTPGRALSAQLAPGTPHCASSGSVLAWPVSRTYGEVGLLCASDLLLPPAGAGGVTWVAPRFLQEWELLQAGRASPAQSHTKEQLVRV